MSEIIQVAFHVSSKIRAGLLSGIYMQTGGVIRDAVTGSIVKHLVPVLPFDKKAGLFRGAVNAAKEIPKVGVIVIIAVAIGAGAAALAFKLYHAPVVKCVEAYQVALKDYLKAISKGKLVQEKLSTLITVFDEMKNLALKRRFAWIFPPGILEDLHAILRNYTDELARVNNVELDVPKVSLVSEGDQLMAEIEHYLKSQDKILSSSKE